MTLTTVEDLAAVVSRAVDYEGSWPTTGGIRGNRVTFSQILEIGRRIRGRSFAIDKAVHRAVSEDQGLALLKMVSIGILLSSSKGAWEVSDEMNQLFPDYEFTLIEDFLAKLVNNVGTFPGFIVDELLQVAQLSAIIAFTRIFAHLKKDNEGSGKHGSERNTQQKPANIPNHQEFTVSNNNHSLLGGLEATGLDTDEDTIPAPNPDPSKPDSTPTKFTHNHLWNEAYEALKREKESEKFVETYEILLRKVFLQPAATNQATQSELDDEALKTLAHDVYSREEQLRSIVRIGLEKVQKAKGATEGYGKFFDLVEPFKSVIGAGLSSVPQAALPWAIVSASLDVLAKPARTNKVLYTGVSQVVSRMDWYAGLTESILEPENINDSHPLERARRELKNRIASLYQALLLYQIKSTCYYYRNQLWVFLSGFLDIDDWSGDLQALKDAEDAVRKDCEQYNKQHIKSVLDRVLVFEEAQIALKRDMEREKEDRNCLRDLHWIDPRDEIQDIKARKDDLVDDSYRWIMDTVEFKNFIDWEDRDAPNLLWITGQAGMGKTMLLVGIIQELTKERLSNSDAPNISYFFCQGSSGELNSGLGVLRSLLWLLLVQQPHLISHVREAYKTAGKKTFTGAVAFEKLSGILKSALEDRELEPIILVLDALDECDQADRPSLIRFLNTVLSSPKTKARVKWIISTRPLPEIQMDMNSAGRYLNSMLSLDNRDLEGPISAFIDHKIQQLREKGHEEEDLKMVSDRLRERSGNTFLWVWLVCKELMISRVRAWSEILDSVPDKLAELYKYLLERINSFKLKVDSEDCKNVLAATTLAYQNLSLSELAVLASLPTEKDARQAVDLCGSFLTIRDKTVYMIHQSAKEHLKDHFEEIHGIDQDSGHLRIFQRCLTKLDTTLRRNIYQLSNIGVLSTDIQTPNPDPLCSVRYACRYWVHHLKNSGITMQDEKDVHKFLLKHFLHWLEALSLMKIIFECRPVIKMLQGLVEPAKGSNLALFLDDAAWFAMKSHGIIETAPLQAYASAVIFAPESSVVKSVFEKDAPKWISKWPQMPPLWSTEIARLVGHWHWVKAISFSHDGKLLASASEDDTLKLWNPLTGRCLQTILLQSKARAVAFSHDGRLLASASEDGTVKLWDLPLMVDGTMEKQTEIVSLKCHADWINALVFSNDDKVLVSASNDSTIRLWDWSMGQEISKLDGHTGEVTSVAYSNDGMLLASSSYDGTARIWDPREAVSFSYNGQMLATASADTTVRVWNNVTGKERYIFKDHTERVNSVSFCQGHHLLATGSDDGTVRLWNPAEGDSLQILGSHSRRVRAVSLAPDGEYLASASYDGDIRVWDPAGNREMGAWAEGHEDVKQITFSPDGNYLASVAYDKIIDIWDPKTGKKLWSLEGHTGIVTAVTYSGNSDLLASCSWDRMIRIWELRTGQQLHALEGHSDIVSTVTFSRHNDFLVSSSCDNTIRIWDTLRVWDPDTGMQLRVLEDHTDAVLTEAISRDDQMLATGSIDKTVRIWDLESGKPLWTLKGHDGPVEDVRYSYDNQL
ncbi:hypothetical protein UA08_02283 [Talaromyces atroroseus]|uniref:NACHT domain-containing protein n=1 Tax=Talaromyces atroroseus TaxID=1441469 RepID=A0A225AL81_TALAT|nr:hypothetical protein UA08_02283 [Talaromyces atroroseus]OKL62331.1 hypothetical protein UA08_02283 [Talaromyces atroroseus]